MNSKVYLGQVFHKRYSPNPHAFVYPSGMLFIDLEEKSLFSNNFWGWKNKLWKFRPNDRSNPHQTLSEFYKQEYFKQTQKSFTGKIFLLTQPSFLGKNFNPVSFAFLYRESHLEAVIAQVTNTPYGEKHCYVLVNNSATNCFSGETQKQMWVSPFNSTNQQYRWKIEHQNNLFIVMENLEDGVCVFKATLDLKPYNWSKRSINRFVIKQPLGWASILFRIYFQAFLLFLKKSPIYKHPNSKA